MSFKVGGIQQIGIGVEDAAHAFEHYKKDFGFNVKIFDDAATASLMKQYTGGDAHSRRAILTLNENGGGGLEIWQFTNRKASNAKEFGPGDLGIIALGVDGISSNNTPWKRDDYGNLFKINSAEKTSGIKEVFVGVKSLEKSTPFYQTLLKDATVSNGNLEYKGRDYATQSLFTANPSNTAFSKILGPFTVTLVESPEGQHYFKDRFWGDKGFIHLCLDVENMDGLKSTCDAANIPFSVDSKGNFDMGDTGGRFAYVEDPDGTLIELVEVLKFPISKKPRIQIPLHWKILKPLPKFLLKILK